MRREYFIKTLAISVVMVVQLTARAQEPVLKVDINVDASRQESEVTEPGYYPWKLTSTPATMVFEGVTFTFKNGTVDDSWYKVGVQAPYYARMAGDGVWTTGVELHISGLQAGHHSLVTFHNTFNETTFSPLDIYINNELVIDDLEPSRRVFSNDEAESAYMEFDVTEGETIIVRFASSTDVTIPINAFYLNKSDPKKIARFPYPTDKEEHVNIDNDTLIFQWKAPESAQSYNFYLGTDEDDIKSAGTGSPFFVGTISDTFLVKNGFYSMDKYYWRVDPVDNVNDTTKGDVWYFKKRIPAFPEAEGYGGYAIGGRGGKVIYVTNLKDSGPGSFRDAVENVDGPRTILFAVSGLITLSGPVRINDSYVTVAGQTAPGKGICFRWAPVGVVGDDLIVQNIRVRVGYGVTYDGMGLTGANHSILDHCSVSWSVDEAFSSRNAKNITLQRSLISEALNLADHDIQHSEHGYAGSILGNIGSFHHNLLAHCKGRNWSIAGVLDGDGIIAGRMDIFNMVVYNWGDRTTDGFCRDLNFVNNYYKKGPSSTKQYALLVDNEGFAGTQRYYVAGNVIPGIADETQGGKTYVCASTYTTCPLVDEPVYESMATIHSARDAYKLVLSDVGCTQPAFDDHDVRILTETLNGTYTYKGSITGKAGFPDREMDVGGWEPYSGFTRSENWDTDSDGLPDWWETAVGMDPESAANDFSDSNADTDRNGYTNLEEYLHWMDRPHFFMNEKSSIDIDLAQFARGFQNSPEFSILNEVNGHADLSQGTSLVSFTPSASGLCEIEFLVRDSDGTEMERKIGIYNGQVPLDSGFTYTYNLGREGGVTITVDSVNHVNGVISVESVSVSSLSGSKTITEQNGTLQLEATVLPVLATNKEVTWSSSDPDIASVSQDGLVTAKSNGSVTISAIAKENNITGTIKITVNVLNSVQDDSMDRLVIYPNPASTDLYIQSEAGFNNLLEISILDMTGRILTRESIFRFENGNSVRLDISYLNQGMYFIRVHDSEMNFTETFMKK